VTITDLIFFADFEVLMEYFGLKNTSSLRVATPLRVYVTFSQKFSYSANILTTSIYVLFSFHDKIRIYFTFEIP
jgi:hypothetical protein